MKKLLKLTAAAVLLTLLIPAFAASAAASGEVILGGTPFGLTMYTSGVIVINVDGDSDSPANKAGIRENDVITKANGEELRSNEQLKSIVDASGGEDIELSVIRGKSPISVTVTPKVEDGACTLGMWIRDSTAGLGTVTYYDEGTRSFGALGHGITDRDTGLLMPLSRGEIMDAVITSVSKAEPGKAGGLNGFMTSDVIGTITENSAYGIFGSCTAVPQGKRIRCAADSEIKTGEALIYCTFDDGETKPYSVMIDKLNLDDNTGRSMVIRVTDKALLDKTGGIIQGMSGSPIVQNGKLIGAVTHVFVNSPEQGYGISINNMRRAQQTDAHSIGGSGVTLQDMLSR